MVGHAVAVDAIDAEMVAAGVLPLAWYDVLLELAEAPAGRLRLHELANRVVLSRSGLTRLVDRIAAAGYVCREPSPDDRRGTYAVLTDAGRAALARAWPVYERGIQEHFARFLSDAEARALVNALGRMVAERRARWQTGGEAPERAVSHDPL